MKAAAYGLLAAGLLLASPAVARTLTVGDGKDYKLPSEAIAAAQDGDTVLIAPGDYFDCAIVHQNSLTIAGEGDGAALTDKACEGKALLVIRNGGVTVRNLALRRARVPDGNGAGIRLEGPGITIDHVTFDNDQVGLLSGGEGGQITIDDCRFERGGVGGGQAKFAVMVGRSALLRVTKSIFKEVKGGQISTEADRSEIVGNTINTGEGDTGAGDGPAEAVLATAGALLLDDNLITVGPNAPRADAAVALWDGATGTLRHNRLVNNTQQHLALLLDWSWGSPTLDGNQIPAGDEAVTSSGVWRHRAASQFYARKAEARSLASEMKRILKRHLW